MSDSAFEFDPLPSPGTNKSAPATDCGRCGGDRFVPVNIPAPVVDGRDGGYTEAYMRCPLCNYTPTSAQ
jgi:hypothetical protein